jgi:hypothetical protein
VTGTAGAAQVHGAAPSAAPRVCVLVPVTRPAYPLERLYTDYSAPLKSGR